MKVSTLLIILIIIGGIVGFAYHKGYFKKGSEAVENSFDTHYTKGAGLYQGQKYEEAIAEFEKALSLDAKNADAPTALRRIGDCYKEIGKLKNDKEYYQKAVSYYDRCLTEFPNYEMRGDVEKAKELVGSIGHY